jgi:hypothetical protein
LADPNPESALNEEAAKLLLENHDKFIEEATRHTVVHASFTSSIPINKSDSNKDNDENRKRRNNSDEVFQTRSSLSELKKKLKRL